MRKIDLCKLGEQGGQRILQRHEQTQVGALHLTTIMASGLEPARAQGEQIVHEMVIVKSAGLSSLVTAPPSMKTTPSSLRFSFKLLPRPGRCQRQLEFER